MFHKLNLKLMKLEKTKIHINDSKIINTEYVVKFPNCISRLQ